MNRVAPMWAFDEFAQIGIDFGDAAQAEAYDRRQGDRDAANVQLLHELRVGQRHTVVDIGCGTGSLAIAAAQAGAAVHAVDISAAMLELASNKAVKAGVKEISFHHAGFLTHMFEPASADFVFSQFALHHLPDFWKQTALLRVAETLRPGGIFYLKDVVFSFEPKLQEEALEAWLAAVSREDGRGWSRAEFEGHVRKEHSTFAWIIEGMLRRAGFVIDRAEYSLSVYATFVSRKG